MPASPPLHSGCRFHPLRSIDQGRSFFRSRQEPRKCRSRKARKRGTSADLQAKTRPGRNPPKKKCGILDLQSWIMDLELALRAPVLTPSGAEGSLFLPIVLDRRSRPFVDRFGGSKILNVGSWILNRRTEHRYLPRAEPRGQLPLPTAPANPERSRG